MKAFIKTEKYGWEKFCFLSPTSRVDANLKKPDSNPIEKKTLRIAMYAKRLEIIPNSEVVKTLV